MKDTIVLEKDLSKELQSLRLLVKVSAVGVCASITTGIYLSRRGLNSEKEYVAVAAAAAAGIYCVSGLVIGTIFLGLQD